MTDFKPRRGSYIRKRGGRHYYRRAIPEWFRHEYDGKVEWNILLEGQTDADRLSEAHVHAHQHNRELESGIGARILSAVEISDTPEGPDASIRLDFSDTPLPDGYIVRPFRAYRDGKIVETFKIAYSRDADFLRRAERDGFLPMSYEEGMAQIALHSLVAEANAAPNSDKKEIAELKAANVREEIDGLSVLRGETVMSTLPKWHQREQQRISTQDSHKRRIQKFVDLHGNLPLASVTKRHVIEFVDHVQTMTHNGKPLAATSVSYYLASLAALLAFAASSDLIPFNPALGVKPPKDQRPKIAKSWESFEKNEVKALVLTAADLWTKRRVYTAKTKLHLATRTSDLITALHMLVWTGARPEEICQLRLLDIDLDKQTINITNDDSDDEKGQRSRFIKNENSVRVVPVHSRLAGFVQEHIEVLSDEYSGSLLFPSFAPQLETGRYARTISHEWSSKLRAKVTQNPRKVLYSLRHSWKAESLAVGMPEHVRLALMGHGGENPAAARYGQGADWINEKRRYLEMMNCI